MNALKRYPKLTALAVLMMPFGFVVLTVAWTIREMKQMRDRS